MESIEKNNRNNFNVIIDNQNDNPLKLKKPTSQALVPKNETSPPSIHDDTPKTLLKKLQLFLSKLKWSNVMILLGLHCGTVLAIWHAMNHDVKFLTWFLAAILGSSSGLGMSVGAHRLWAHRTFKASFLLKLLLAFLQVMTMNGSAFSYARDHRTHHKFSDTEKDPKNPSRGLFYSHIGWWLMKKSDTVKKAGRKLNFDDLRNDPIVWFQHRFYVPLFLLFGLLIPTLIPHFLFGETLLSSFLICGILRTTVVLHHLFTVNSIAHFFGHRPYDFRIRPTENRLVIYLSLGEGNHNFHHTFPWDYSSSEKLAWEFFNPSTLFIDFFSLLSMAYDRKRASRQVIENTIKRKGVVAYFDPPRSVSFRLINGLLDWQIGLLVTGWPIYPVLIYKYFTGQKLFCF